MNLEPRIRTQLQLELESVSATTGSVEDVVARGRRRRLLYRTTQTMAVAAAAILAVATTALIINTMESSPSEVTTPVVVEGLDTFPSPLTGTQLPVISQDPLVLRAEVGEPPETPPDGTELVLTPINQLSDDEATTLARALADHDAVGGVVVAIGEIDNVRLFAHVATELRLVVLDGDDPGSVHSMGGTLTQSRMVLRSSTFAIGQVPEQAVVGQASFAGSSVWQTPVEGIILMPYDEPNVGAGTLKMYNAAGEVISETLIGPANSWVVGVGLMQTDTEVWEQRLDRACADGVWEQDVAERLAAEFIAEDLATVELRPGFAEPNAGTGSYILWEMAEQWCPEQFPPQGPSFDPTGWSDDSQGEPVQTAWIVPAAAPISGRYAHASVWTGREVIIWGGIHNPSDQNPELIDGARYLPATDSWTTMAPAPAGMSGAARAVWTGSRMIVRTDHAPDGPVQMASYDPTTDTWEEIVLGPTTPSESYAMVWTGTEIILLGGATGDGLSGLADAYRPGVGWRTIAPPPNGPGVAPTVAWTDAGLIVWGRETGCGVEAGSSCAVGNIYDPGADQWMRIPHEGVPLGESNGITWTGTDVLTMRIGYCSGDCGELRAYSPGTRSWRTLATASDMDQPITNPTLVDDVVYVWDSSGAGFAYETATDEWTNLGVQPMQGRHNATVVSIDSGVFVWGGWDGVASSAPFADGFILVP